MFASPRPGTCTPAMRERAAPQHFAWKWTLVMLSARVVSTVERCAPGYYGAECSACKPCTVGRCDDGFEGSGACREAAAKTEGAQIGERSQIVDDSGDVVLSTIFVSKRYPMAAKPNCRECEGYFSKWVSSALKFNLSPVVFHDGLPDTITSSTSGRGVQFVPVKLGNYSVNDERLLLYYAYLSGQSVSVYPEFRMLDSAELENVKPRISEIFMTDISDVEFLRNPFRLIFGQRYRLYVGSEGHRVNTSWLRKKIKTCKMNLSFADDTFYNAGILGGETVNVLKFLDCYVRLFFQIPRRSRGHNCNMAVFNEALRSCFHPNVLNTGAPLHTRFKMYEYSSSNCYIRHK